MLRLGPGLLLARRDGSVDWLETSDTYEAGEVLDPDYVRDLLAGISWK